ncbi:hypothetical protein MWU52_10205 [Jannaschia sp. S6380]|uniref:hypothetical protein n=1 Tax=Jannaschia sp. S6380 TaxID=2926408 RepID=UPI001FF21AD3|nr:hypothetical protein [Jannaschia sp. S6380]MCK0167921.1 hypothetical protein [Jannaschia sp. S6380]
MKLSLHNPFRPQERAARTARKPRPMPTHESMYLEHLRRKAEAERQRHAWERRIDW